MKRIALGCLIILFSIGLGNCKKSPYQKIKVAEVAHSIFYAPQYVALTEGYFEEEGLKIDLYNANGADKVTAALLSGDVQIVLQGPEPTIYLYNQDHENYLINFIQLTKKDGSFIMAREPIEDFNLQMLKGKSILGGRAGGVPEMTLEYIIKEAGLTLMKNSYEADVNVRTDIQFGAMSGAFISGEGDFTTLFEPTCTEVEKAGHGYVVASVGSLSGEVPYTAYSTTKRYFNKHQDILEKFTRAIYKGQQFVKNSTDEEVAKILQKTFKEIPLANLITIVGRYRLIEAWCDTPIFGEAGFNKLMDIISLAGELDKRADYTKIVNNTIAQKVIK